MHKFKSGSYISQSYYKSFQPELIDRQWSIKDMELLSLLSKADRQLGRLDMYSEHLPDLDLYIGMHVVKEATQSSIIEGTQTNMEEALLEKEDIEVEKRDDWNEVQNYISAMNHALELLDKIPFSNRLIKSTHKVLMHGVRGEFKLPGEYRSSQNWIGGASIKDALFVPPVYTSIAELMGDLEKFAHNTTYPLPDLIKIGILHYQFETIHPFLDGNGRIGRLLITLYLVEKEILKKPILYISDFFERNRSLYYDNLMRVRTHNDLNQWLKFFLVGVIETAEGGVETFDKILKLKSESEKIIQDLGAKSANLLKVLQYLLRHPIIDIQGIMRITQKSQRTAYNILEDMQDLGILEPMNGNTRGKKFRFTKYIKLFQ